MNPTEQLRDIRSLESISWWPLAPGWWVLLAIIMLTGLIIALLIYRSRSKKQQGADWRKMARKEWLTLYPAHASPYQQITFLSILLRRVAIQSHGRKDCAGLSGQKWLDWLTRHDPHYFDWAEQGKLLIELPYMPPDVRIETSEVESLYQAIRAWIDGPT